MGSKEIIMTPSEVWKGYLSNKNSVNKRIVEIARYEDYGVSIYFYEEAENRLNIVVEVDDIEIYSEEVISERDCTSTVKRIYDKYLSPDILEIIQDIRDSDDSRFEQEDAISEREANLDELVFDFVMGVMGGDTYFDGGVYDFDDMCDDLKDHFLEYMYRKYGLDIYRPMILEDENGEEFFEEYPYECMEFDDNPLYE